MFFTANADDADAVVACSQASFQGDGLDRRRLEASPNKAGSLSANALALSRTGRVSLLGMILILLAPSHSSYPSQIDCTAAAAGDDRPPTSSAVGSVPFVVTGAACEGCRRCLWR